MRQKKTLREDRQGGDLFFNSECSCDETNSHANV